MVAKCGICRHFWTRIWSVRLQSVAIRGVVLAKCRTVVRISSQKAGKKTKKKGEEKEERREKRIEKREERRGERERRGEKRRGEERRKERGEPRGDRSEEHRGRQKRGEERGKKKEERREEKKQERKGERMTLDLGILRSCAWDVIFFRCTCQCLHSGLWILMTQQKGSRFDVGGLGLAVDTKSVRSVRKLSDLVAKFKKKTEEREDRGEERGEERRQKTEERRGARAHMREPTAWPRSSP